MPKLLLCIQKIGNGLLENFGKIAALANGERMSNIFQSDEALGSGW
jgi:hypothetical protein